jgi:putative ABC transport system substrate-binding protein
VEGRNIMIEDRSASDDADRLAALAAELVDVRVDLIVAAGSQAVRAAQHATKAIPIVMTSSSDPVGTHFVASLARPGGNITGLSLLSPDLSTKRLELLEEIVKPLTRAAVFWNPDDPPANISLRETQEAAKALGVQLSVHETRDAKDFESAFGAAIRDGARGLILLPAPLLNSGAKAIARLALKNRIPAISYASEYPDAGGRQADRISNSPQHFS